MPRIFKKLVLVLATFMSGAMTSKKTDIALKWVLYMNSSLCFWKNTIDVRALIDLDNKVNIIILAYAAKLGLKTYYIDVKAQKIDSSIFETLKIALISFQIENKLGWAWFF